MKKIIIYIFAVLFISSSTAVFGQTIAVDQGNPEKTYQIGVGVKFIAMEYGNDPFYAAVIPMGSRISSIYEDSLFFYLDTNLTWGITHFFFDYGIGTGLRYYPQFTKFLENNKTLSFYGGGEVGTFFFNNATLLGRAGSDIDVYLADDTSIFLGGEVFYRKEYRLANYIEKDYWFISSPGWAINGGFRIRFNTSPRRGNSRSL